jgi:hypothetical protein
VPARWQISAPKAQIKLMRQNQMSILMRQGFGGVVLIRRVTPCRFAIGSIAVWATLIFCLTAARAADALPATEPVDQARQTPTPAYSPQGCQMERYKAFARQAEMPAITITNKTILEVGGSVKTDVSRLAHISSKEKKALAGQFGVPAGVIDKLVQRASKISQPSADQLAQDIRTAVVDYRFLQGEWKRYHPPLAGQKTKTDALQALQTGDISKAWELYDGLQKPQAPSIGQPPPPTNLRVVAE